MRGGRWREAASPGPPPQPEQRPGAPLTFHAGRVPLHPPGAALLGPPHGGGAAGSGASGAGGRAARLGRRRRPRAGPMLTSRDVSAASDGHRAPTGPARGGEGGGGRKGPASAGVPAERRSRGRLDAAGPRPSSPPRGERGAGTAPGGFCPDLRARSAEGLRQQPGKNQRSFCDGNYFLKPVTAAGPKLPFGFNRRPHASSGWTDGSRCTSNRTRAATGTACLRGRGKASCRPRASAFPRSRRRRQPQPTVNVDRDPRFPRDRELGRCRGGGGHDGVGDRSPPRAGLRKPAYGDGTLATGCSPQLPQRRNTCAFSVVIERFPKGEQSTWHALTLYFIVVIYRNAVVARRAGAQPVPASPSAMPNTSALEESRRNCRTIHFLSSEAA